MCFLASYIDRMLPILGTENEEILKNKIQVWSNPFCVLSSLFIHSSFACLVLGKDSWFGVPQIGITFVLPCTLRWNKQELNTLFWSRGFQITWNNSEKKKLSLIIPITISALGYFFISVPFLFLNLCTQLSRRPSFIQTSLPNKTRQLASICAGVWHQYTNSISRSHRWELYVGMTPDSILLHGQRAAL